MIFSGPDGLQYCMREALANVFRESENRAWERSLIEWAEQFLRPDKAFLDVGAHIGTWALPYSRKVPKVIALEASRENYLRLCTGIGLNDCWNIDALHVAAGERAGEVDLNVGVSDWSGFGCSVGDFPINGETRPERVRMAPVDELGIDVPIGLVKIDVEGYELEVLKGMAKTLVSNELPPLLVECWAFDWYKEKREATLRHLDSLGYNCTPIVGWEHMLLAARKRPPRAVAARRRPPAAPRQHGSDDTLAVLFSVLPRADTTGAHLLKALTELVPVRFIDPLASPTSEVEGASAVLCIDDDHGWPVPSVPDDVPIYYWCIDSYRMDDELYLGGTRRERIEHFTHVFYAQKAEADALGGTWLPLAVDRTQYTYSPEPARYDWCFIGNMNQSRPEFLDALREQIPSSFVGNAYGRDADFIYNSSRIAINLSAGTDLNMRMFEAQATSALLLTNRVHNGEDELFRHLATFSDVAECVEKARAFIADDAQRKAMAAAQALDMEQHTYDARARQLLTAIGWQLPSR